MKTSHFHSLIIAGALGSITAQAQSVIVPGNLADTEGSFNNGLPFNIQSFGLPSERYQQVYDSFLFSSLPAGGVEITGMAFRIAVGDGGGQSFSSTLPDVQIDLSTTAADENSLSSTFAANVGANDTVVDPAGPLTLSGTVTSPGPAPNAFNVVINFATPFFYKPANGNLLLDVRNFGGGLTTQFDANYVPNDGIGRAATYTSGVTSPTSDLADSSGLVTEFMYQPVPEPGILALAGLGGLTLLLKLRRRWF